MTSKTIKPCSNPNCNAINSGIDECIKPLVEALNDAGFKTVASCCGHRNRPGTIALEGGIELLITDFDTARQIENYFPDIHGNYKNRPAQADGEPTNFKDWYAESEHDLFNYPLEAMEAAWNAALQSRQPAPCDGGECGIGGFCDDCHKLSGQAEK